MTVRNLGTGAVCHDPEIVRVSTGSYGHRMTDLGIHIEVLEFGKPVPEGCLLIPFPRKPDGSPDPGAGYPDSAKIISMAEEQGYTMVFIEMAPYA